MARVRLRTVSVWRLATWLTSAVAALSVLTGVLAATAGSTFVLVGVARLVPEGVREWVSLTGAFTGFVLLVAAWGLKRRYRSAWYLAVVLLPVTALQGVVQSSAYSLPLVAFSVVTLAVVLLSRRSFDRRLNPEGGQVAAIAVLIGTLVYGTVGTYALRDVFPTVETPLDALYYTVVTASTVGYGDVTPAPESDVARLFTASLVVVGTAGFAVAAGSLLAPAIQARVKNALGRMTQAELDMLEDHVVVLGFGDLTEPILEELRDSQTVVVTTKTDRAAALSDRGYRTLVADPSDDETLDRVHLERARAVVAAGDSDAEDALAVLTARQSRPDVRIVAAASERANVEKLRRAGADAVVSPAVIGSRLLARSALGRDDTTEAAEDVFGGAVDERD